jgi:mannose-6-phosphate isomerase-like protein (cupin superfamily)
VNLRHKLAKVRELWHPGIIAQVDDYHVKLARVQGEFVWHKHEDQDELFLVLSGELTIRMRDREVTLGESDLFVVPRGVEHCPFAAAETEVLVLERADTKHTGDVVSELTVPDQDWR